MHNIDQLHSLFISCSNISINNVLMDWRTSVSFIPSDGFHQTPFRGIFTRTGAPGLQCYKSRVLLLWLGKKKKTSKKTVKIFLPLLSQPCWPCAWFLRSTYRTLNPIIDLCMSPVTGFSLWPLVKTTSRTLIVTHFSSFSYLFTS